MINIDDARLKVDHLSEQFKKLAELTWMPDEWYGIDFNIDDHMSAVDPDKNERVQKLWLEIQRQLPPGYSIDGNLIRHLSWNQAQDWGDISRQDVPREKDRLQQYKRRLELVSYLQSLHPDVSRTSDTVLNNGIEEALRAVFSILETRIREKINITDGSPTVSNIGRAFRTGQLVAPYPENNDGARDFLMGAIGYYRNIITHHTLPDDRNNITSSLPLFGLAHEAFRLLDDCKVSNFPGARVKSEPTSTN